MRNATIEQLTSIEAKILHPKHARGGRMGTPA